MPRFFGAIILEEALYYIYILECEDKSLYTGITPDITARIRTHYYKLPSAAKYTKSHKVKELRLLYKAKDKSSALKLEAYIKRFSSLKKKNLIENPSLVFDKFEENLFEIIPNVSINDFLLCKENEYENLKKLYIDENNNLNTFFCGNEKGIAYSDHPQKSKMACIVINEKSYFLGKPNSEFLKLTENKTV